MAGTFVKLAHGVAAVDFDVGPFAQAVAEPEIALVKAEIGGMQTLHVRERAVGELEVDEAGDLGGEVEFATAEDAVFITVGQFELDQVFGVVEDQGVVGVAQAVPGTGGRVVVDADLDVVVGEERPVPEGVGAQAEDLLQVAAAAEVVG